MRELSENISQINSILWCNNYIPKRLIMHRPEKVRGRSRGEVVSARREAQAQLFYMLQT